MFASEACVQASPAKEYRIMIICAPVSSYYNSGEVRVKIADHFSRAPQGGTGYAKAAGNYAGQFYPTQLAIDEGYQQIIWTDAATHQFIEEAGTMNLFFYIGDKLITAPTSDNALLRPVINAISTSYLVSYIIVFLVLYLVVFNDDNNSLKYIYLSVKHLSNKDIIIGVTMIN